MICCGGGSSRTPHSDNLGRLANSHKLVGARAAESGVGERAVEAGVGERAVEAGVGARAGEAGVSGGDSCNGSDASEEKSSSGHPSCCLFQQALLCGPSCKQHANANQMQTKMLTKMQTKMQTQMLTKCKPNANRMLTKMQTQMQTKMLTKCKPKC